MKQIKSGDFDTRYINIVEGNGERTSGLLVQEDGLLRVMGVLPHGYRFEPKNTDQARKLICWLEDFIERQEEGL